MKVGIEMVVAIVPAAGLGTRVGQGKNKLLLALGGEAIISHTLRALDACKVNHIILAVRQEEKHEMEELLRSLFLSASYKLVVGGKERQDSIANALEHLPEECQIVVVHDGARPFLEKEIYDEVLLAAMKDGAAISAVPSKDTLKHSKSGMIIDSTLERSEIWQAQTPQIFSAPIIKEAYKKAQDENFSGTDDASLVEHLGMKVKLVLGNYRNIKITTPEDLIWGEALLSSKGEKQMRVGKGFDVHRLVGGRPLILGGEVIAHDKGLLGHSDADVLAHAISDALLGAAGLGDIGQHFPDTDQAYKGADSIVLLKKVMEMVSKEGWAIENLDATIMAERPKIMPHIPNIKSNLAEAMEINTKQVNIKATTTEKLGFVGREEGIAAEAIVLLRKG